MIEFVSGAMCWVALSLVWRSVRSVRSVRAVYTRMQVPPPVTPGSWGKIVQRYDPISPYTPEQQAAMQRETP